MKFTKSSIQTMIIAAIVFVAYNVTLFGICGFQNHSATFWVSWVFVIVSFLSIGGICVVLGFEQKGTYLRDWLFNYPFIKHSIIFAISELCASTLFIILDHIVKTGIAFVIMFLFLCIYVIFSISCFMAKDKIMTVQEEVKNATASMKLLHTDATVLVDRCADLETKEQLKQLSEAIYYSDPVSNEVLSDLEYNIGETIKDCGVAISTQNFTYARELCAKAMMLLSERNKKTKILK